jgi:uncharacterized membrane protein YozB (DUF420 family)
MPDVATAPSIASPVRSPKLAQFSKMICWAAIVSLAVAFIAKYVFRYYLNYNEAAFTDPVKGAANYWVQRRWLLMHITGGMVALLLGPFQFWSGFRQRYMNVHRWTGRVFLTGVGVGSIAAYHMAVVTTFGWAFGAALVALATAWLSTAGMAYLSILKGQVQMHKEWMIRAYVVTFAFVTFRVLNDYGPTSQLKPDQDRALTIGWACWAIPLLVTEVILQLRRMRKPARAN